MKASIFHYKHTLIWLSAVLFLFAAASCSDEETVVDETETSVSVETIILNPKSAGPGDTVQATVVITGQMPVGTAPTIKWSADGGTFLSDSQQSVGWVAPTTSGVFRLNCTVTTSAGSKSENADVFVGESDVVVPSQAGEIHLIPASSDFYYLHSLGGDAGVWDSSDVYMSTGGGAPVSASARMGAQFAFSPDLGWAAFAVIESLQTTNTEDPINLYLLNVNTGTQKRITRDTSLPGGTRHHQFKRPYFSPDGTSITYQGFLPHPQSGNVDTLDVFDYKIQTGQSVNVTLSDTQSERRRNMLPTYSTDYSWLVFVSDRQLRDRWDLYGAPITNGVVDTQLQSVRQLTTGGLIGSGAYTGLGRVIQVWSPTQSVAAVVGGNQSDGYLHLVQTTGSGAQVTDVFETGDAIVEVVWSPDGATLAVSSLVQLETGGAFVNVLFSVTSTGAVTMRHAALPGDRIYDMAWSPNGHFMVYRIVRSSQSWFELIDVDGGSNFLAPVVITPTAAPGNRSSYAAQMSTASKIGVNSESKTIVYMIRFRSTVTPSVFTLDVSGAVP